MTTSTQTQLRRGTATQVNAMTPALGEAVVNTTDKRLHVGDGSRAGGFPHATAADVQRQRFVYPTVGGTANALTLTNAPAVAAYGAGLRQVFKAAAANTGSPVTAAVDGLAARTLKKLVGGSLTDLAVGDLVSGAVYELVDDGTYFQVQGGLGGGGALPAAVTGTLPLLAASAQTYTLGVDFTTYAAYDVFLTDIGLYNGGGGGKDVRIDVSTDNGSSFASASRRGMTFVPGSGVNSSPIEAAGYGTTPPDGYAGVLAQASAAGGCVLTSSSAAGSVFSQCVTRFSTAAAVNLIQFSTSGYTYFNGGPVLLQPKSKR